MGIGIRPTVDFAFKLMLGNPEHTNVTIHFLNAILEGQCRITHVQILNPILSKHTDEDKLSVLDILATDEHGRMLNIEMQTSLPSELPQRLAYYASCLYVGQLKEGFLYADLRPSITICVLTQAMFSQRPELHLEFRMREKSGLTLTDDLQVHLLQLPKLRVSRQNVYDASPIERWAFFLMNAEHLTDDDVCCLFPDREIAEAAGVLKMISQSPEDQLFYFGRLKFRRDEEARLRKAELEGFEKGRQEGRQEGLQEGRQEGLQEGWKEGRQEGRIQLLQQILGLPESTHDDLAAFDSLQLSELESDLLQQIRNKRSQGLSG